MEPIKQKSKIIDVVNFIVVFIFICFMVGAFFVYQYLKQEGYFESAVLEEPVSEPITLEQTEQAISTLESSDDIGVESMNSALKNIPESDSEVSILEVTKALDSLE